MTVKIGTALWVLYTSQAYEDEFQLFLTEEAAHAHLMQEVKEAYPALEWNMGDEFDREVLHEFINNNGIEFSWSVEKATVQE